MENELVSAVLAMDDATVVQEREEALAAGVAFPETFVVVIDTQYDFMMPEGKLYVPAAEATILPVIQFLASLSPEEIAGVLFTFDTHYKDIYEASEEAKQFPIHCEKGTKGWGNVFNPDIIDPKIEVVSLHKGVFNMWEEEHVDIRGRDGRPLAVDGDRESFFKALKAAGVKKVVIVGVAADFCVKWAADGFLERGFEVEVPRRLTAGIVRDIDTVVAEDYEGRNIRVTL